MAQHLSQTVYGKAFEYACVKAFYDRLSGTQPVVIIDSAPMETAHSFYYELAENKRMNMTLAADAAVHVIKKLEPQLCYPDKNYPLFLSLQSDASGQAGDVRDVLCIRNQNDWEIGLSCKHNHFAVKHSRLSATINFGRDWFGISNSDNYFHNIVPVFEELKDIRNNSIASGRVALWRDIPKKEERFYVPILEAFITELTSLHINNSTLIPSRLIQYLIGRNDFYKVISVENNKYTRVDAINIYGTLNKQSEGKSSIIKVPKLHLPHEFYYIGFVPNSKNTIRIVCDEGWEISMRIHNASSRVEPSLKFDVNLVSMPVTICSQIQPWL